MEGVRQGIAMVRCALLQEVRRFHLPGETVGRGEWQGPLPPIALTLGPLWSLLPTPTLLYLLVKLLRWACSLLPITS